MKKVIMLLLALGLATEVANADFTFGEPTNLGPPVNSLASDGSPHISPDGLSLYIQSGRPGGSGGADLWVTTRETPDYNWGTPVNLGPMVNSSADDWAPCISPDGLELFFTSKRPGGPGGFSDIWLTTQATQEEDWGMPEPLGPNVNTSDFDGHPSISGDGLSLFFSAGRSGGFGNSDIWVTSRTSFSDPWPEPVNLGATVNSSAFEGEQDISADGLCLFFSGDRPGGSGGWDIWVTRRATKNDPWGNPVNLGPKVNSSDTDSMADISDDGSVLFLVSDRSGGSGDFDIWEVPMVPIVDFNGDGIVDAADMCVMIDHWVENYPSCDIGPMPWGDGIVDVQDLIVLAEHLFEEIFPPELVACWKLNETEGNIAHNSVDENHGSVYGEPLWQPVDGKKDGALEFDGIDDYVETDFVLNPAGGAFSAFAWIKACTPGQVIISQTDGTGQIWLGADPADGKLMTGLAPLAGRSPAQPLVSEFVITEGDWHHVGIVIPTYGVRNLYVDGMRVASDTQGVGPPSSNGGLYFGTSKTLDAGTFFSGLIDDVRIYDVALTSEEIAALAR